MSLVVTMAKSKSQTERSGRLDITSIEDDQIKNPLICDHDLAMLFANSVSILLMIFVVSIDVSPSWDL